MATRFLVALMLACGCGGALPSSGDGGSDGGGVGGVGVGVGVGVGSGSGGDGFIGAGGVDLAAPLDASVTAHDLGLATSADLGASNSQCPTTLPAMGKPCGIPGLQCDWSFAGGSIGFAYCDDNNRWASGTRDPSCASVPVGGGACSTSLECDYQIGSPGDCVEQCGCDTSVDRMLCTITCKCDTTNGEGPCPSSNGNIIEGGTIPPTHPGGYCPASTTDECVATRTIPMDCGLDEMSSSTTCDCIDDVWQCSTS